MALLFPSMPAHLRPALDRAIAAIPEPWLLAPKSGEVFKSKELCKKRLQAFAFIQGFAVVIGKSDKNRAIFHCIHHSAETRNDRGLEPRVVKDKEGGIISQRQRDTYCQKKDCLWYCFYSFKPVSRGIEERQWILTVKELVHISSDGIEHLMHTNPFYYKIHQKATEEYRQLTAAGKQFRTAIVPYSTTRRVLEQEEYGMTLSAKEYYNLVRTPLNRVEPLHTANALLVVLEDHGFIFRCRVELEEDIEGRVIGRKLIQVFFIHPKQVHLGQRFIANFIMIIDGTFNTNILRLPLLAAVGVSNEGTSFPLAFSYTSSKSEEAFGFFIDSLKGVNTGMLKVVLGDQAAGLIAAIPHYLSTAQLQHCDWHAVEAMKRRFRKGGYTSNQIDGTDDFPGLAKLSWDYIQSNTFEALETNRESLLAALQPKDRTYIRETWQPKESRVVYAYTRLYPNLGCTSSQRGESYHVVIKQVTNGQLSLEESCRRLVRRVLDILKELSMDEDKAQT
jgi:hypothetical protein